MWMSKRKLEALKEEMRTEMSSRIFDLCSREREVIRDHQERHNGENRKRLDDKVLMHDFILSLASIGFKSSDLGVSTYEFTAAQAIRAILKAMDMTLVKVPGEIVAKYNDVPKAPQTEEKKA